jgi:hypothetical protein
MDWKNKALPHPISRAVAGPINGYVNPAGISARDSDSGTRYAINSAYSWGKR